MTWNRPSFLEFFAGGGMARLGLQNQWECVFANDFSPKKARSYRENFPPADELVEGDVFDLSVSDLPDGAQMAWASFPCQDLSVAGNGRGINAERSGSFWGFWRLMQELKLEKMPTPIVVLENVIGTISIRNGLDFEFLLRTFAEAGYRVGPMVIDGRHFVPQSRPRLFLVAIIDELTLPSTLVQSFPDNLWHPNLLRRAHHKIPDDLKAKWIWRNMPQPKERNLDLTGSLEENPVGVMWHSHEETQRLLDLMNPLHREKVSQLQKTGERSVGTIYRRIRHKNGKKEQRAEIRTDNTSGCLRTGSGGSSKQFVMIVEGGSIRSRLLSPRETARLMGVPDTYKLPSGYGEAYHLMGDGLVVPAVKWLSKHILTPALDPKYSSSEAYGVKMDGFQSRFLESLPPYA